MWFQSSSQEKRNHSRVLLNALKGLTFFMLHIALLNCMSLPGIRKSETEKKNWVQELESRITEEHGYLLHVKSFWNPFFLFKHHLFLGLLNVCMHHLKHGII